MKQKLMIVGSSFVPPMKHIWGNLEEYFEIHFGNIGNWSEILDETNFDKTTVCIFVLEDLNFEGQRNQSEIFLNLLSVIRQRLQITSSSFLLCYSLYTPSNIITKSKRPGYFAKEKIEIQNMCDKFPQFYTIDLDTLFGKMGLDAAYSYRNWYFSNSRLTNVAWNVLSLAVSNVLGRLRSVPKKILVLDCDNTIWGGVIGEDGLSGILLGQDGLGKAYKDFQSAVVEILKTGTLLGIASKNNEADVWQVFDSHSQMVIKKSDVIISKINWENKDSSLLQMSSELNLALDSFVFWDDNPFEREQIRNRLPEVTTVEPPETVELWPTFLKELDLFSNFLITQDDLDKQNQYRMKFEFDKFRDQIGDSNDFLKNIQLSAKLVPIDEQNMGRAEQLSLKTNQFNLRSMRLKANEIREFIDNENNLGYLIQLTDSFGDHGLAASFLVKTEKEVAFVESFNLSCRVFGRKLEFWMADKIEELCLGIGAQTVIFESIPTDKSRAVISKFFESEYFVKLTEFPLSLETLVTSNEVRTNIRNLFLLNPSRAKIEVREIYD